MCDAMLAIRDQINYSFDTAVPVGSDQSKIANLKSEIKNLHVKFSLFA
jgi:hypothetical protein